MGPHLTISGEDAGSGVGRRVGSHHFAQRADTWLSPVCGHLAVPHNVCPLDSVSPLPLVSPISKHVLTARLLIIRGGKRDSQDSELHFANGQRIITAG